jgi:hypothetical protein
MDWLPTDEDDDEELDWWFEMMWGLPRQADTGRRALRPRSG